MKCDELLRIFCPNVMMFALTSYWVVIILLLCLNWGILASELRLGPSTSPVRPKLSDVVASGWNADHFRQDVPIKLRRSSNDVTHPTLSKFDFSTRDSRLGFIRKVYAIFGAQVLSTIAATYFIMNDRDTASFLLKNTNNITAGSFLTSLGVLFALGSSEELRHHPPWNFLLLAIFTLSESLTVGTFSLLMGARSVFLGATHSAAAILGIALYTLQPHPRFDLTTRGSGLLSALTALTVGSVLGLFFNMPLWDNLLSGATAVLFATYLFHDMQMVVGGKHHKRQYGQKDYVLAALSLYQDAINLFMRIVQLLREQERRRKDREESE